jgi:amino acid adenylation domain-containing protein
VIVGGGSLPVRCAEILAGENHEIRAVASNDAELKNWAKENDVAYFAPDANLAENLRLFSFDYLFSIVNENILRADVLKLPRKMAINYHDAPLPRYAGTHATSWALLGGEKIHGVSWHLIAEKVDAGDILKRQKVEISENDTALTLNTKCFEAAINSFAELIEELAAETSEPEKQNLAERTFFPRRKRPPNGAVIVWNNRAEDISRLVRALNFGAHPNPLGSAKFQIENDFFIVRELEILNFQAKNAPGTVTKIGDDFLQVSAADREVILRNISRLDGKKISVSELAAKFDSRENFKLENPDAETARRIETLVEKTCRNEKFWVEKLTALEPAAIPFADATALTETPEFSTAKMPIPFAVLRFLTDQKSNWKTHEFLSAAFAALIARLSGADYFDVGYKTCETQNEFAGLENLFAFELPLRFEIDWQKSFSEFFETGRKRIEAVENHPPYARDLFARYPQFRQAAEQKNEFALPVCVEVTKRLVDFRAAGNSELTLVVSQSETECLWVYERRRISAENVEKLIAHFETFLKSIARDSDCEIARLSLLSAAEREKVLFGWNDNFADYPKNQCVHELFEAQAARTPEATALIFGAERLTYRELNSRANRLAHYLQTFGVAPETLVGVCVERSIEMIVGVLGILKAGGAYVPLDPNYPKDRIRLMLEDSNASIVLAKEKTAADLNQHQSKIVCLDRDWNLIEAESEGNPSSAVAPENLAYVIYTSGSTGKPKGVAIEHRSTVAFLHWALSVFAPEQLKGVLASTSVCFDLSVYEMFAPLAAGGAIILVENVLHLPDAPAAGEVTLINSVPSAMTELLRIEGVPASAKTVNLAGEPLKPALVRAIYALGTVEKVFDLYGPTEDTTYSTYTLRDEGAATIGRPISNTQAYILDKFLQPVPAGIPGELYLAGDGLARGYLNCPEMTAEKFIKNPFSRNSAARMYKTGDLARFLPNGEIEYLGRIDNQVKVRGFRIELGEIEAALSSHAAVREAVVVAREDEPGEKRLVAYLAANRNQTVKSNELREFLKRKLPDYMIPSAFVELEQMPLTPNGKIDKKNLPAPAANVFDAERVFVSHRDSLEERLVEIWETILQVQPVGVSDDFFELGGHSLQAVRMFAEIEKTFNKNIPLATLFQAGTIEKLAAILRQDGWDAPESSLVPIQPAGDKPIFFCVHAKGGNVLFYRDLARRLGADQPFYGIQARRLGGRQVGHHDIREMAEFYIKEIQTVQPEGPYFLGGSSFGGLAAFEIAQQLRAAGHQVAMLALLDTGTPDYPKFLPGTTRFKRKFYNFVRRFQLQRDNLKSLDARGKFDYALQKLSKVRLKYRRKIRDNYKKAVRKTFQFFKGKGAIPKSYIQLEDQIWRAGQNYAPQIYDGKVTLFRATLQPLGIQPDATLGWEKFIGGELEIHEVPGHHGSIVVEPYVAELAEKLKMCLEKAQTAEKPFAGDAQKTKARKPEFARV